MNIKIHSANFDITPAIDTYVSKKIGMLEKFLEKSENILCEVEIGKTTEHHKHGDLFKAEVNIVLSGGVQIYAVSETSDLYSAIDAVRDSAEREILSKKNKRETLFKRGSAHMKNLLKRIDFRKNR